MAGAAQKRVSYRYTFAFDDGRRKEFAVDLDYDTLAMIPPQRDMHPGWTELSYRKCPNCPLSEAEHKRCPIAANLVDVVDFFKDSLSYETVEVSVQAHGRTYLKRTTLQEGVSGLIGIFMVTSGCPILNKLRPMVDTHLPFMTSEESSYRMISMYLMAQYFRERQGLRADWELKDLLRFLAEASETNASFCRRLQSLGIKDASLNAMSTLNALGEITSLSIETEDFARWERIFRESYGEP